jgi:uncharacterized membrane protein (DUF2068 family)
MLEKSDEPKYLGLLKNITRYFGFFMVFVYLAFGLFMIISGVFLNALSPFQKNSIGVILMIYGTFRAYRIYKESKD